MQLSVLLSLDVELFWFGFSSRLLGTLFFARWYITEQTPYIPYCAGNIPWFIISQLGWIRWDHIGCWGLVCPKLSSQMVREHSSNATCPTVPNWMFRTPAAMGHGTIIIIPMLYHTSHLLLLVVASSVTIRVWRRNVESWLLPWQSCWSRGQNGEIW